MLARWGNGAARRVRAVAPGLVRVIDEDLGRSATGAEDRPGFRRLVTEVTMGQVGLALGMGISGSGGTGIS